MRLFAVSASAYTGGAGDKASAVKPVDVKTCYGCHTQIQEFHTQGRHATVNCVHCHEGLNDHLSKGVKPVTRMDHKACATCHLAQYNSFVQNNL